LENKMENLEKTVCPWKKPVMEHPERYSFPEDFPVNCFECKNSDEKCFIYKSLQKNGFLSVANS